MTGCLCELGSLRGFTQGLLQEYLFLTICKAAKGLSDSFWNNATYARVGGIKLAELGLLELDFLYRVDWKIVPNPEVLVDYYRGLVERSEGYELDEDESSSLDEDDEDSGEGEISEIKDQDLKSGEATDVQWKAWMSENSSRTSAAKTAIEKERFGGVWGLTCTVVQIYVVGWV
ncbi:putative Nuc-1 negative regulatory protein preg [Glarea lozoyensis 74030]|uniref:Putative Nuc-1 negative regulatory protein preg n=1 Tax=Glarea lozoyensis (strain ATCC 74030 / MF5533) TaxID=1104152 RepID=H0ELK9_GLAL7|nr:putative Nuc-1 negative regulatory protein preg [Glarea lozoyensis 74030]